MRSVLNPKCFLHDTHMISVDNDHNHKIEINLLNTVSSCNFSLDQDDILFDNTFEKTDIEFIKKIPIEFVQLSNGILYGLFRLLRNYQIIRIENKHVYSVGSHCGPIDIYPFENGRWIELFQDEPVVKNNECLFLLISNKTYTFERTCTITGENKQFFISGGNELFVNETTRLRSMYTFISVSSEYVLFPDLSVKKFSEVFSENTNLKTYVVIFPKNVSARTILEQIPTRTKNFTFATPVLHVGIIMTEIRKDSLMKVFRNILHLNSLEFFRDTLFSEFPTLSSANSFVEKVFF